MRNTRQLSLSCKNGISPSGPRKSGAWMNVRRIQITPWMFRRFSIHLVFVREYRLLLASVLILCFLLFAGSPLVAVELRADRWRWSNPAPHGNNILDLLVTPNLAVQVGDAGSVHIESDDGRWRPVFTGCTNYLRGVALLGQRLVVCGENGLILWSDDGAHFNPTQISPSTSDWFEGVAASGQRAVAVGDNGSIYTSTDGITWSKVSSGTDEWLRGVAAIQGVFVAVGENGTILRSSSTGGSWSRVASGTTAHLNRVRSLGSANGSFLCAVGNHGVALVSSTGTAPWTSLASATTNHLYDVCTNDTGLLLVGDRELRYRPAGNATWISQLIAEDTNSPPTWTYLSAWGGGTQWRIAGKTGLFLEGSHTNGSITWQLASDSSYAWIWDVTVQRGIYVAVGDLASIKTSLDGILWARELVPAEATNAVLLGVGGTTNLLLAVGSSGTVLLSQSSLLSAIITNYVGTNVVVTNTTFNSLGVIWTNLPAFTTNSLQGIAAHDGKFVITGERGTVFSSVDGSNWLDQTFSSTNFLSGVAAGPGGWVIVGNRGSLLRSDSGESWIHVPMQTTNWLYRARYLGGVYVVVGQNGSIYTSEDTVNWFLRPSSTIQWLNDAGFVEDTWFVVGTQGTVLMSTNLSEWTPLMIPSIKSLYATANHQGQLLVAGVEGLTLRNQLVPDTSPVNILAYHRTSAETVQGTDLATTVYELLLLGGHPDQVFQFQSCTHLESVQWTNHASVELFDPSGTIYLLRTRDLTNTPPAEVYRTALVP